jgi:hypothetical protein
MATTNNPIDPLTISDVHERAQAWAYLTGTLEARVSHRDIEIASLKLEVERLTAMVDDRDRELLAARAHIAALL